MHQIGHADDKLRLVDLIGKRGDDNAVLGYFRFPAHHYRSSAGRIDLFNIVAIKHYAAGGKVRPFNPFHKVVGGGIREKQEMTNGSHDFS